VDSREVSETRISELMSILPRFSSQCGVSINQAADIIVKTFLAGSKVLICGNGGSAADSQHFAAEFVSAFSRDITRQGLPAMALTVDTSIITAYSNDFGYEGVFSRQVEAFGRPGDTLIALTTSGSSKNCLQAVRKAKEIGISTIAFTRTSGAISAEVDTSIEVPSANTQHIQECHMVAYHVITEIVEQSLFGGK
jgi:D-sedoheptulose 7-phosphate isomerase